MPSLFELLKADHDRIKGLIQEIGRTTNGDWKKREKLFDELRFELGAHAHFEDEVAFPRIREALGAQDTNPIANEENEHAKIGELVARLEALDTKSSEWSDTIHELQFFFSRHAANEEATFFPQAARRLDPDIPERLGQLYEERRSAPVRSS